MASANVDACLRVLKDQPALMLELSLALTKIREAAGVKLTKAEGQEFLQELAKAIETEAIVAAIGWI